MKRIRRIFASLIVVIMIGCLAVRIAWVNNRFAMSRIERYGVGETAEMDDLSYRIKDYEWYFNDRFDELPEDYLREELENVGDYGEDERGVILLAIEVTSHAKEEKNPRKVLDYCSLVVDGVKHQSSGDEYWNDTASIMPGETVLYYKPFVFYSNVYGRKNLAIRLILDEWPEYVSLKVQ